MSMCKRARVTVVVPTYQEAEKWGSFLRAARATLVAGQQLVLEGRVEALRRGVVQGRADPAHRLGNPQGAAGPGEQVTDVLAALVGMEDHPGHVAAAYRRGHA
jgi:hypothetical protein